MTRIYEALKQVEKDRSPSAEVLGFPGLARSNYDVRVESKMRELYRAIAQENSDRGDVIQFLSPRREAGVSRTIRALAGVVASTMGKSVLIVDAKVGSPQYTHYSQHSRRTWSDAMRRNGNVGSVVCRTSIPKISLVKAWHDSETASALLANPEFSDQLVMLKNSVDIVIFDTPSADESGDGLELSSAIDASVLVVEAEKTRWPVAQHIKESIESRGGRIAGVLLSSVPQHIPAFLYNRL